MSAAVFNMLCLLCQNTEEEEAYDTAENGGQLYEAEPQSHYTPHDDLYQNPKESAAEGEALYFIYFNYYYYCCVIGGFSPLAFTQECLHCITGRH